MQLNRVLLAHQNPAVQELAERALGRIGVPLDVAAGSTEAFSLIARDRYKVIVIERDEAMLSALAAAHTGPRPVVIVIGGESDALDADFVSMVMPEPYDPHTLIGVILACVTPEGAPPAIQSPSPLPAEQGEG